LLTYILFCTFAKTIRRKGKKMVDFGHLSDDNRREELIRVLEHSLERLSLQELEALYYDMTVKDYIR